MSDDAMDPMFQPIEDDQETALAERPDQTGIASIARSEVMAQIDAAHQYPREVSRSMREAYELATMTRDVAKSCMYTLERREKGGKKKQIVGPSVRLAEIVATAWGNVQAGARPVDADDWTVTCQGYAWDMQKNVRVLTEVKRRITTADGNRYNEDMILMTANAASSIAYRNAVFRVIPRAYIDRLFAAVKTVAAGEKMTMDQRRREIVENLGKLKVPLDRILAKIDRHRLDDITLDDIEALIGLETRLKEGGESVDSVFPPPAPPPGAEPEQNGKRVDLGAKPTTADPKPAEQRQGPRTLRVGNPSAAAKPGEDKGDEPGWREGDTGGPSGAGGDDGGKAP